MAITLRLYRQNCLTWHHPTGALYLPPYNSELRVLHENREANLNRRFAFRGNWTPAGQRTSVVSNKYDAKGELTNLIARNRLHKRREVVEIFVRRTCERKLVLALARASGFFSAFHVVLVSICEAINHDKREAKMTVPYRCFSSRRHRVCSDAVFSDIVLW
jgi:hypothetical protein